MCRAGSGEWCPGRGGELQCRRVPGGPVHQRGQAGGQDGEVAGRHTIEKDIKLKYLRLVR